MVDNISLRMMTLGLSGEYSNGYGVQSSLFPGVAVAERQDALSWIRPYSLPHF